MRTLLALAAVATVVGSVSAIKCYVCNSHQSADCKDLSTAKSKEYLQDCGDLKDGEKYTLCRKLDMYLDMDFGKEHPSENRVHRACGYQENADTEKTCYYKSGYNTRTWVCACKVDGCNTASLHTAATAVLPLAAIAAVLRGVY
ncbi:hypothetical protein OTU49_004317 [Cherax quadricarinatus]|uniref:Protein sleepless n=1 Tax=Cherax quadricarinatus TaxID=27406 RepID=A0AAW0XE32_CHEQU|nr:uncharacterized protein LOC128695916 [Cherax quadricarinatus]